MRQPPEATSPLDAFYPIAPDLGWLERMVPRGVRTIQLRLKDAPPAEVRRQIGASLEICSRHGAELIVNDYWQDAIRLGAGWVHLGQEDLAHADLAQIRAAGIRIGISTHDEAELATALAACADYIALGPIYETRLKAMAWAPQGLDRIGRWKALVGRLPPVGIGGITPDRRDGVLAAGAQSCAVITDLVTAADPEARIDDWVQWSASRAAPRPLMGAS